MIYFYWITGLGFAIALSVVLSAASDWRSEKSDKN